MLTIKIHVRICNERISQDKPIKNDLIVFNRSLAENKNKIKTNSPAHTYT